MKLLFTTLTFLVSVAAAAAGADAKDDVSVFRPPKFTLDSIVRGVGGQGQDQQDLLLLQQEDNAEAEADDDHRLWTALHDVGMISITNMSSTFRSHKKKMLTTLMTPCAMESTVTKRHDFPDGTRRHTMATHTIPGLGGIQKMMHYQDHHHENHHENHEKHENHHHHDTDDQHDDYHDRTTTKTCRRL